VPPALRRAGVPSVRVADATLARAIVLVRMRLGGGSNRTLARIARKSWEDYLALRRHGLAGRRGCGTTQCDPRSSRCRYFTCGRVCFPINCMIIMHF
jgi:hypothetical protein